MAPSPRRLAGDGRRGRGPPPAKTGRQPPSYSPSGAPRPLLLLLPLLAAGVSALTFGPVPSWLLLGGPDGHSDRRTRPHHDQGPVHRTGPGEGGAVHHPAVRALLRREPRRLASALLPDAAALGEVRQPPFPEGDRDPRPRPDPGPAARGRQQVHGPPDRVPGQGGQRLRPRLPLL